MTPTPAVRLLVVDDHTLFRRGLIALLSRDPRLSVVAEAGDAGEALKLLAGLGADAGPSLVGRLLMLDGRHWETTTIGVRRQVDCPVCRRA